MIVSPDSGWPRPVRSHWERSLTATLQLPGGLLSRPGTACRAREGSTESPAVPAIQSRPLPLRMNRCCIDGGRRNSKSKIPQQPRHGGHGIFLPAGSRQHFCSLDTSTNLDDSITDRDLSNRERNVSIAPEDSRPGREIRRVRSLGARQRATMASQGVCSWGQGQLVRTSFFTLASKDRNPSHSVIARMPVSQNLYRFPFCRSQPRSQPSLSLSRQDLPRAGPI